MGTSQAVAHESFAPVIKTGSKRLASIDIVRGLAVVFMALDHLRDYISNIPFSPENIDRTWMAYFLVRWVTHFCAPAFFLLAGVGAYLYGRSRAVGQVRSFLLTRGVWLVFLEFTIIGFAWSFRPGWAMWGVICCLGLSMIILAAFVSAPRYLTMGFALGVIATHDLFDGLKPADFPHAPWLLLILHRFGMLHWGTHWVLVLFPLVPWFAVTLLGYSMGSLFEGDWRRGRRTLLFAGVGACLLFVVLRVTNAYGNPIAGVAHSSPGDWHPMATISKTVILFLDVEKYPPSLEYLLMTLGPIFILLAVASEPVWGWVGKVLSTYGRVPLFYYILHLFAVHVAAIAVAAMTGQPWHWLLRGGFMHEPDGIDYGHGLGVICATWIVVVPLLYWPCRWFAGVKARHPGSLLRFL